MLQVIPQSSRRKSVLHHPLQLHRLPLPRYLLQLLTIAPSSSEHERSSSTCKHSFAPPNLARHHRCQPIYASFVPFSPPRALCTQEFVWKWCRSSYSCRFRDFNEERDLFFKTACPRLEAFCANRGLLFAPLDLRWGITSEQSGSGYVIKLCLDEVDRSRPYFVLSLGFRNGWAHAPNAANADALLQKTFDIGQEAYPWVGNFKDRSVTEIEILHGAVICLLMSFLPRDSPTVCSLNRHSQRSQPNSACFCLLSRCGIFGAQRSRFAHLH